MASPHRLAAAQTVPVACDVAANTQQHLELTAMAATEGVSLLVFPELSLTGYELAACRRLAFTEDDPRLVPLTAAARRHAMTLVVGAPLAAPSGVHIAALIIEPAGPIKLYTKHHLGAFRAEDNPDGEVPPPEQAHVVAGTSNPLFAWSGRKVATSICADSAYPTHPQTAAELGASVYLSCQFSIAAHMAFKMARLKQAARGHGLNIVFANYGGASGGLDAAGGTCVRAANGEAVVRLPAQGCGLAVAWEDDATWRGQAVLASHLA